MLRFRNTTERTIVWAEFRFQVGNFLLESNDVWVWYLLGYKQNPETKCIIKIVNSLSKQCYQNLNANYVTSMAEQYFTPTNI